MRNIQALFAIVAAVSVCIAQSVSITGKVTDTAGTAISGALVRLEKGGQTATSGADGSFALTPVGVLGQNNQSLTHGLFAAIRNGVLSVDVAEKSGVEMTTFDLSGKALSKVQQTMGAGTHSMALPQRGAGISLYKLRSGKSEVLIKGYSFGKVSQGAAISVQGPAFAALAKQAKITTAINDVIAVTKAGYLNYRVIVTNSDTSGIEIKMIVCEGTVTDTDGNVYQTVKIGNQVWTVENLRTTKYNDGSAIPLVTDSAAWANFATPGYCYYGNTTNADSIRKFGALYNWYAVDTKKLAPIGWHVPTDAEWDTLQKYLIANGYNWDGTTDSNKIAKAMAAKADWWSNITLGGAGNDFRTNNRSGFSGLPGGGRFWYGSFLEGGFCTRWWSATAYDVSTSLSRSLIGGNVDLYLAPYKKGCGFSVRLVKDEEKVTDANGNVYHTVKIGNQVWTVENFRATKYNDGSAIPQVTDSAAWANLAAPGYCYYNNTTNADSIAKFGALYDWYVLSPANPKRIAPAGWHVPTDAEWDTLQNYLIVNGYNWDGTTDSNKIAKALAAKTDWQALLLAGAVGNDLTKNNKSGFSALPGGCRLSDGVFNYIGIGVFLWSTLEDGVLQADNRFFLYSYEYLRRSGYYKSCGFSVRLLKDN
jgi:uncharacterized protein (TIGR02145 family)